MYFAMVLVALSTFSAAVAQDGKTTIDDSGKSRIFRFDNSDSEIQKAYASARLSFRFFWREYSWEQRRIIPGLGMAAVKAPFSDGPGKFVEHMWINELDFDGETIHGKLVNSPNQLTSVKEGDRVEVKIAKISDWMYELSGKTYGGFTIQVLRRGMTKKERAQHDDAWGMDFGDPNNILVCPDFGRKEKESKPANKTAAAKSAASKSKKQDLQAEHPMAKNMVPKLKKFLESDPKRLTETNKLGLNMLHRMALNGSTSSVRMMLEMGADRTLKTKAGKTAYQLAKTAGWKETAKLLAPAPIGKKPNAK